MIVRINSKFELKRICKAIGATPIPRLDAPTPVKLFLIFNKYKHFLKKKDEMGTCDEIYVTEIGS